MVDFMDFSIGKCNIEFGGYCPLHSNRLFDVDKLHISSRVSRMSNGILTNDTMNEWMQSIRWKVIEAKSVSIRYFMLNLYKKYVIEENAWQRFDHFTILRPLQSFLTFKFLRFIWLAVGFMLFVGFNQKNVKSILGASLKHMMRETEWIKFHGIATAAAAAASSNRELIALHH